MFTLGRILPGIPTGTLQPNQLTIIGTWVCAGLPPAASTVELRLTSPAAGPVGVVFAATASTGAPGQPPAGAVQWVIPGWAGLTCGEKIGFEVRGECGGVMGPWTSMGTKDIDCGGGCPRVEAGVPVYGACSGTPASQSVTLSATVMMNRGVSQQFRWEYGDGQSSPVQTLTSIGTNSPLTLTTTHLYADRAAPYVACLRAVGQECPLLCVEVRTSCSTVACPAVNLTVATGGCTAAGTVPVTYTLGFNPPLPQGAQAFVQLNFGGPDAAGNTSASPAVNTAAGPVASVQHTAEFRHRPGGYASSATVAILAGGQLCPAANLTVQVDPPACIDCPDPANPVTVLVTPADPDWCAPATPGQTATLEARINWSAPAPAVPPVPVRYDWTVSAPNGAATATRSSTTATVSTGTGWAGTAALPGGALNLNAAGSYAVSVTVLFDAAAGLPTGPGGVPACNLTGSAALTLDPCEGRTRCPVLTGLTETAGCVPATGGPAVFGFAAAVDDPAGTARAFDWDFGDPGSQGNTQTTSTANATHSYAAPGTYTVTVRMRSADPGCPNPASMLTRTVTVAACAPPPPRPDDSSTSFCAALLWAGLIAMLVGGLMLVLGCILANNVPGGQAAGAAVSVIGGIILGIGVVVFALWAWLCSSLTACSVILAAIDFVTVLIFLFGIITIVIAIIAIFIPVSWPCAFAAAANWGGWGIILGILTSIARGMNCLVPGPGPSGASGSSSSALMAGTGTGQMRVAAASGRGLGDRVSGVTSAMGITPCEGCRKRAARLNALVPGRSQ